MRRFYVSKGCALTLGLEEGSIICLFPFESLSIESKAIVLEYHNEVMNSGRSENERYKEYTLQDVESISKENKLLYTASGLEVWYDYLQEVEQ